MIKKQSTPKQKCSSIALNKHVNCIETLLKVYVGQKLFAILNKEKLKIPIFRKNVKKNTSSLSEQTKMIQIGRDRYGPVNDEICSFPFPSVSQKGL